jgi:hypothetical protein
MKYLHPTHGKNNYYCVLYFKHYTVGLATIFGMEREEEERATRTT